jgi:hypothetical protein
MSTELRDYAARIGYLYLPSDDATTRYELAVERYEAGGDAQALREGLLAIGIDAASIRWHVANRGAHMPCICGEES